MAEKKLYEGMFLVDSGKAASDWDGINASIQRVLDRAEAEVVSMRKWDDRKLAYDIRSTSRGLYMLCYFKAEGGKIQGIEKDVQLSDDIIRVLILSTEQMSQEDIDKDTPAAKSEKEKALAEQKNKSGVSVDGDQSDETAEDRARTSDEDFDMDQDMEEDETEPEDDFDQDEETDL